MVISLKIAPQGSIWLQPRILSMVIWRIYGKQFFRNALSIFIGQIPLSLVSAAAYGEGKAFNGQHKSNISLPKWVICT
jgi:hypothetical protein